MSRIRVLTLVSLTCAAALLAAGCAGSPAPGRAGQIMRDGSHKAPAGQAPQIKSQFDVYDDIVVDNATGDVWQRGEGGQMDQDEAGAYCASLTAAGLDRWRLPTRNQLLSIAGAFSRESAVFDIPRQNLDGEYYWSVDMDGFPLMNYAVNPKLGESRLMRSGSKGPVRCVYSLKFRYIKSRLGLK